MQVTLAVAATVELELGVYGQETRNWRELARGEGEPGETLAIGGFGLAGDW